MRTIIKLGFLGLAALAYAKRKHLVLASVGAIASLEEKITTSVNSWTRRGEQTLRNSQSKKQR